MWDDGKTGHITQHYRSNEAMIYSRRRTIQVHATLGENLLAAWDHQEFIHWLYREQVGMFILQFHLVRLENEETS